MKKSICCFALAALALPPFANASKPLPVISANLEVTSLISAIEQNRSLKCEPISSKNAKLGAHGSVDVKVYCNQYSQDGEPEANVTWIQIKGSLYDRHFEIASVRVVSAE